jgi:hypothetical protein
MTNKLKLEDYHRSFSIPLEELGVKGNLKHPYTSLGESICEIANIISKHVLLEQLIELYNDDKDKY